MMQLAALAKHHTILPDPLRTWSLVTARRKMCTKLLGCRHARYLGMQSDQQGHAVRIMVGYLGTYGSYVPVCEAQWSPWRRLLAPTGRRGG